MDFLYDPPTFGPKSYADRERGSLDLRSKRCNYGRAVLVTGWDDARQAEPKDNDISKVPRRSMTLSTYNRLATITDGSLPKTTYQDFTEGMFDLKKYYGEVDYKRPLVTSKTWKSSIISRDTGRPCEGFAAVLPRHPPDHGRGYYFTTHLDSYRTPIPPAKCVKEHVVDMTDWTVAIKRCNSQFTDVDDYRRFGRNTWMDESGLYANSGVKKVCPYFRLKVRPFQDRPI